MERGVKPPFKILIIIYHHLVNLNVPHIPFRLIPPSQQQPRRRQGTAHSISSPMYRENSEIAVINGETEAISRYTTLIPCKRDMQSRNARYCYLSIRWSRFSLFLPLPLVSSRFIYFSNRFLSRSGKIFRSKKKKKKSLSTLAGFNGSRKTNGKGA